MVSGANPGIMQLRNNSFKSMRDWGNQRAADLWEYNLPRDFKRPTHSDQEMELFIRSKYERGRV